MTTPGGSSASWQISASSSAVNGVVSAGFRIATFPHASAGASFHAAMDSGKFQGTICADDAERLDLDRVDAVAELVGPAGVVEEVRGRERDVDVAGLPERLAPVDRLDDRELAGALLDQAGDPEQVLRRARAGAGRPRFLTARAPSTARATSSGPAHATSAIGSSVAGLIVAS